MKLKIFKICLVIALVSFFLFEINADEENNRSKRKAGKRKHESNAETTTETLIVKNEKYLDRNGEFTTGSVVVMAPSIHDTTDATTSKPRKSNKGKRRKSKKQSRKEKAKKAKEIGLKNIIDMLFDKEDNPSQNNTIQLSTVEILSTVPITSIPADVTSFPKKEQQSRASKLMPNRNMHTEETTEERVTSDISYGDNKPLVQLSNDKTNNNPSKNNIVIPTTEVMKYSAKKDQSGAAMSSCNIRIIEAKFMELMSKEKVPDDEVRKWKGAQTDEDKIIILNETLLLRNLLPIAACETDDERRTTASRAPTLKICDPEEVRLKITEYVRNGDLSHFDVIYLKLGTYSREEKARLLNDTLVENGLPPLPPCRRRDNLEEHESDKPNAKVEEKSSLTLKSEMGPTYGMTEEVTSTTSSLNSLDASTKAETPKGNCTLAANVSTLEEVYNVVQKMEEQQMLRTGTLEKVKSGEISLTELKRMITEAAVTAGKLPESCLSYDKPPKNPPRLGGSAKLNTKQLQQLNQLNSLIKAGYLPRDTLDKLVRGEISQEWLKANISQNRDLILSLLPEAFRILIEEGKMPPEIEAAIFSGTHNKTEIAQMIVQDDDLIKELLPQALLDMLQGRPVPMELKLLIVSGKNETEIQKELAENEYIIEQMMTSSMFFFYKLFQDETNRIINVALSVTIVVVLAFVMVSLGCTMTITKIAEHAKKPKGVVIALFAQFVIMPAAAFGLTQAFKLELYAAMAVLICGCCPGGNLSNMLAYSLSGDMNLSILMTTCSSILGLGFMPLSIFIYSRFIIPVDSASIIPFDKIVINITLTIIPVGVGIAIRHFRPHWVRNVMRVGGVVLVVCTIIVGVLAGVMLGDAFFVYFPLPVLGCCAILPMTGYVFGYLFAWIAGEAPKCRRTICVETGCQNVQLCSTVLKLAFNPILVGVLFLMPLVYMLFQIVEAFLIIFIFRLYNRLRGHQELVEETSEEKKKSDLESGEDEKKEEEKEEKDTLLKEKSDTPATKLPDSEQKKKDGDEDNSDLAEIWPLDGEPTPAYLDSFKTVETEKFV